MLSGDSRRAPGQSLVSQQLTASSNSAEAPSRQNLRLMPRCTGNSRAGGDNTFCRESAIRNAGQRYFRSDEVISVHLKVCSDFYRIDRTTLLPVVNELPGSLDELDMDEVEEAQIAGLMSMREELPDFSLDDQEVARAQEQRPGVAAGGLTG